MLAQEERRLVCLAGVAGAEGVMVVVAEWEQYRMFVKVVGNGGEGFRGCEWACKPECSLPSAQGVAHGNCLRPVWIGKAIVRHPWRGFNPSGLADQAATYLLRDSSCSSRETMESTASPEVVSEFGKMAAKFSCSTLRKVSRSASSTPSRTARVSRFSPEPRDMSRATLSMLLSMYIAMDCTDWLVEQPRVPVVIPKVWLPKVALVVAASTCGAIPDWPFQIMAPTPQPGWAKIGRAS